MLAHIRHQLAENWSDENHFRDQSGGQKASVNSAVGSTLDKHLAYQTDYSTSLMAQLQHVETEYAKLQLKTAAQEGEIEDLKQVSWSCVC
jgi:hypothetical protein